MKKGFTLIEMLVTITLLAAISITVGISITSMLHRQEEKSYANYKSYVEDCACLYAELHDIYASETLINIADIIESGNIRKDVVNPKNKKTVLEEKNNIVKIMWHDNERTCNYEMDQ